MNLELIIARWRKNWEHGRNKHGLGPTDDEHWSQFLDTLTVSQVLGSLILYEQILAEEEEIQHIHAMNATSHKE